ncbi:MAG: metal-sulfur cluster assembly factor [Pseudomonadota bacterium]
MTPHNNNIEGLTTERINAALKGDIDPETGIKIVDLGLVYGIVQSHDRIEVTMTLTTPACPMSGQLVEETKGATQAVVDTSKEVVIRLKWEPQWNPEMMSDKAKELLGRH